MEGSYPSVIAQPVSFCGSGGKTGAVVEVMKMCLSTGPCVSSPDHAMTAFPEAKYARTERSNSSLGFGVSTRDMGFWCVRVVNMPDEYCVEAKVRPVPFPP